ncbi:hypothetical protein [Flexivirga sp. B27]
MGAVDEAQLHRDGVHHPSFLARLGESLEFFDGFGGVEDFALVAAPDVTTGFGNPTGRFEPKHTVDLSAYAGQTVKLTFTGTEDVY